MVKARLPELETKENLGKKTLNFVPIFVKNVATNIANIFS